MIRLDSRLAPHCDSGARGKRKDAPAFHTASTARAMATARTAAKARSRPCVIAALH